MPLRAKIAAIDFHLPERIVTNDELAAQFPDWPAAKIEEKTGIVARHIAAPDETSSDLAVKAAQRLFARGKVKPEEIDFVLFCTQSPDYALPTSACLIQHRLGIPPRAGALDFNLGCSGYIYGLALATGMLESGIVSKILLLTGETYSKYIAPDDKSVRTLFGDAGSATLVQAVESEQRLIGPFIFGTDGSGGSHLQFNGLGCRAPGTRTASEGNGIHMNGPAILAFTMQVVPRTVEQILSAASLKRDEVDYFIFHQANLFIMNILRDRCKIDPPKFVVSLRDTGNTVSNTIPIAARELAASGRIQEAARAMLVGFGVGLSWGGCIAVLDKDI